MIPLSAFRVKIGESVADGTKFDNTAQLTFKWSCESNTVTSPRYELVKSGDRPKPFPGDTLTCTVGVRNTGTVAAPGIVATDTLPGGNGPPRVDTVAGVDLTNAVDTQEPLARLVTYTVKVARTGSVPLAGVSFVDDMTGVLDDAKYNDDAEVTTGSLSYAASKLSWSGTSRSVVRRPSRTP